jgi:hypothetical protein
LEINVDAGEGEEPKGYEDGNHIYYRVTEKGNLEY